MSIFVCLFESPQHQSCNFLILSPGSQLYRCSLVTPTRFMACVYNCFHLWFFCSQHWPGGDRFYHRAASNHLRRQASCHHSSPQVAPCFCYVARITEELYQKALICHLTSYWKCRTKDPPSRLKTNRATKGHLGIIGPSYKCQDRWLNSTQNKNRKFSDLRRPIKWVNRCSLNTYADPELTPCPHHHQCDHLLMQFKWLDVLSRHPLVTSLRNVVFGLQSVSSKKLISFQKLKMGRCQMKSIFLVSLKEIRKSGCPGPTTRHGKNWHLLGSSCPFIQDSGVQARSAPSPPHLLSYIWGFSLWDIL